VFQFWGALHSPPGFLPGFLVKDPVRKVRFVLVLTAKSLAFIVGVLGGLFQPQSLEKNKMLPADTETVIESSPHPRREAG
jgi:hypothetical protein